MAKHRIENGKQLVHASNNGDFLFFAGFDQALIEGTNNRIETCCGEGSHV